MSQTTSQSDPGPARASRWRSALLFFVAGAAVATICTVVALRWMNLVPYGASDDQPAWLKAIREGIGWLPWILVAVVFGLRMRRGPGIRSGFFLLGTATPMLLLLAHLFLGTSVASYLHSRPFDAALWRRGESEGDDLSWPPRLCMVDDLVGSGRLDGLSREEVVALLGDPIDSRVPAGSDRPDIFYHLGPERGFIRIDSEWLFIRFGDDGRVARYWLQRD